MLLTNPLLLGIESRATQRGAPRAPPPHPSSSSSPTRGRLHRRRGNLRISTELTPTKSLSTSCTLCCNPPIWGVLEYKDHQLLDIGHRSAQTRINCCILSMILVFLSPPEPPETLTLTRTTMLTAVPTPQHHSSMSCSSFHCEGCKFGLPDQIATRHQTSFE